MKKLAIAFIIALTIFLLLGILNFNLFKHFGIGCQPDPFPRPKVIDTWSSALNERGYHRAANEKPDNIPDQKRPPAGEPVFHATGSVESSGNSGELDIELIAVETPDGSKWVKGWVDGREIVFDRLDWVDTCYEDHSDFSLIVECALVDGPDFGAGLAYEPLHFWGMNAGLFLTADVNQDILTAPDWAAGGVRVSSDWWIFTGGVDVGYRVGEESGLHTGLALGLAVGL